LISCYNQIKADLSELKFYLEYYYLFLYSLNSRLNKNLNTLFIESKNDAGFLKIEGKLHNFLFQMRRLKDEYFTREYDDLNADNKEKEEDFKGEDKDNKEKIAINFDEVKNLKIDLALDNTEETKLKASTDKSNIFSKPLFYPKNFFYLKYFFDVIIKDSVNFFINIDQISEELLLKTSEKDISNKIYIDYLIKRRKKLLNTPDIISYLWNPNKKIKKVLKDNFFYSIVFWKYSLIRNNDKSSEICRICEEQFPIKKFILHVSYCMKWKIIQKRLIENKEKLKKLIKKLFVILTQNTYNADDCNGQILNNPDLNDETNTFHNNLISILSIEKNKNKENYESSSLGLLSLGRIINFLIQISQDINSFKNLYKQSLYKSLINTLLEKESIIEDYLREKLKLNDYTKITDNEKNYLDEHKISDSNELLTILDESYSKHKLANLETNSPVIKSRGRNKSDLLYSPLQSSKFNSLNNPMKSPVNTVQNKQNPLNPLNQKSSILVGNSRLNSKSSYLESLISPDKKCRVSFQNRNQTSTDLNQGKL